MGIGALRQHHKVEPTSPIVRPQPITEIPKVVEPVQEVKNKEGVFPDGRDNAKELSSKSKA